jgi:hypothetical protein
MVMSKVIGTHLPVNNIEPVEMFQGAKKFSSVKATAILIKFAFPLQVVEQFSSVNYRGTN